MVCQSRHEDIVGTPTDRILQFLATGKFDPLFRGWPGQNTLDSIRRGTGALQTAIIEELRRREARVRPPSVIAHGERNLQELARAKLGPMVRGLFSRNEREPLLLLLERSVVFLTTPDEIEHQIQRTSLDTAWKLANIYLGSINAEPLGQDFPHLVGYSEGTTPYVSLAYFVNDEPFADFLVHEAAHVFHNAKRETVGLPQKGAVNGFCPRSRMASVGRSRWATSVACSSKPPVAGARSRVKCRDCPSSPVPTCQTKLVLSTIQECWLFATEHPVAVFGIKLPFQS